jgi:hypothetical protein
MGKKTYGKKISKKEANKHFNLVMQLKKNSFKALGAALKDEKQALRYYCGKENGYNTDLCFLFSVEVLDSLLASIKSNGGHGVAIFNGVRSKEDSRDESTGDYSDVDGRPTVMIFPYKDTGGKNTEGEEEIVILGDDGFEHPGTGGKPGGGALEPNDNGEYELPTLFNRSEVWKFRGI